MLTSAGSWNVFIAGVTLMQKECMVDRTWKESRPGLRKSTWPVLQTLKESMIPNCCSVWPRLLACSNALMDVKFTDLALMNFE